jgi:hypothetical protein
VVKRTIICLLSVWRKEAAWEFMVLPVITEAIAAKALSGAVFVAATALLPVLVCITCSVIHVGRRCSTVPDIKT